MSNFLKNLGSLILYCFPAILASVILVYNLHERTYEVDSEIKQRARIVLEGHESPEQKEIENEFYKDNEIFNRLIKILEREKLAGNLEQLIEPASTEQKTKNNSIRSRLESAWFFTSTLIIGLTLLPYLLLGGRASFGELSHERRTKYRVSTNDFILKFLVAFIIGFGWVYVLHPIGRGASITYGFIISMDVISTNTLPIYIDSKNLLPPLVCGFLGWYLQLLGHFFQKFVLDDVTSTRVYGLLFKKFLFVWGIALVLSSIMSSEEGKFVMFIVGFFPLSAMSILKKFGLRAVQGDTHQQDSLSQIPALSRWQIIRLEEEGIDAVPGLAAASPAALKAATPLRASMIDFWIDAARLASLVGDEKYEGLKESCITATEFIKKSQDPAFVQRLKENYAINNPEEIVRILHESFDVELSPAAKTNPQ